MQKDNALTWTKVPGTTICSVSRERLSRIRWVEKDTLTPCRYTNSLCSLGCWYAIARSNKSPVHNHSLFGNGRVQFQPVDGLLSQRQDSPPHLLNRPTNGKALNAPGQP